MKAAYIDGQGAPKVLKYGDLPDPQAGPGEVLVDIHAASVNGADWKVRSGQYAQITEFPYVLGRDFSGVVAECGEGVSDFKPGDAVFGVCPGGQEGCYAEKLAVDASVVAKKPEGFSHVEMAAVSLIGLTAIVSIEDTLKIEKGETLLVQGGAGGVAGFAVQLAKSLGARVLSTASTANLEYVRALGADVVIDYTGGDFADFFANCDAVFETVGGTVAERSYGVLKPGGRIAFIGSGPQPPLCPRDDVTPLRPKVGRDRPHLERIVDLLESGAVKLPEITPYPLSEARAAHEVSEGRHLRGKLVFEIR